MTMVSVGATERSKEFSLSSYASGTSGFHSDEHHQRRQEAPHRTRAPSREASSNSLNEKGLCSVQHSESPHNSPYHAAASGVPPLCHYPPPPYAHYGYSQAHVHPHLPYYPASPHISSQHTSEEKISTHESPSIEAQLSLGSSPPTDESLAGGAGPTSHAFVPKASSSTSSVPSTSNTNGQGHGHGHGQHIHPPLPPPPSYYSHYPPWPYHPTAIPPYPPMYAGAPHGSYRPAPLMFPPGQGHPYFNNHIDTMMQQSPQNSALSSSMESSPSSQEEKKNFHSTAFSSDQNSTSTSGDDSSPSTSNLETALDTSKFPAEDDGSLMVPSAGSDSTHVPPKDPPKKRFKRSLSGTEATIPVDMDMDTTSNLSIEPSNSLESSKSGLLEFDPNFQNQALQVTPPIVPMQHSLPIANSQATRTDFQSKEYTMPPPLTTNPDQAFELPQSNNVSFPFFSRPFRFSSPFQSSAILPLPQQQPPQSSQDPKTTIHMPSNSRHTHLSPLGHSNLNTTNSHQASSLQMGVSKLSIHSSGTKHHPSIPTSNNDVTHTGTDPNVSHTVHERRVRKNQNSRIRAARLKYSIVAIRKKDPSERTQGEADALELFEERRRRKNERSRELAIEKKQKMDQIMLKAESEWTQEEKGFIEETMTAKYRKNLGDRVRRKRLKDKGD